MAIRIEKLHKRYDAVHALRGIDLEIAAGGIVGLLGPNGAGKTTLVEILEGMRQPTTGNVSVLGLDPTREARKLKERIGVQLQSTSIPKDLKTKEVISLFASFYDSALAIDEVLRLVGMEEKAGAIVHTLSGGQKQRLALGLALINDPELILLDEPTTGLDPMARRNIHEVIREQRQRGRSVLLTTHYIEEAEQLCDRVIIIREGEIVADGSPFDLVGKASGRSTIWIAVEGEMDPAPLINTGAEPLPDESEYRRFSTGKPAATIIALGEMLRTQNLKLIDLRMKRPTLEDVYLEMVGDSIMKTTETTG